MVPLEETVKQEQEVIIKSRSSNAGFESIMTSKTQKLKSERINKDGGNRGSITECDIGFAEEEVNELGGNEI